jgi:hypothetical protein
MMQAVRTIREGKVNGDVSTIIGLESPLMTFDDVGGEAIAGNFAARAHRAAAQSF